MFIFLFLFQYYVVSYFENIPSLQSSANGLTVAHVSVSIFKNNNTTTTHAMKLVSKNVGHTNHRRKKIVLANSCKGKIWMDRIRPSICPEDFLLYIQKKCYPDITLTLYYGDVINVKLWTRAYKKDF